MRVRTLSARGSSIIRIQIPWKTRTFMLYIGAKEATNLVTGNQNNRWTEI